MRKKIPMRVGSSLLRASVSAAALTAMAAAAMAGPASAQDATPPAPAAAPASPAAPAAPQADTVVVVTGQRAALRSAINVKKNADVILDSVSADDAGKLPDNSVTEVLQRIAGVNMTRIQTGAVGSENFLAEGTGITIRGLDSVVSELNGRDSFSSVNGRSLAWEDISPELMQGVDVYKSAEASLPEGGLGGVINLRTRQPFDYKGLTISGSLEGNYADYANAAHPGGNVLVSDRWDTSHGQFGLLVNLAYSDLSTKADGVQVQPYFAQVYDPTISTSTLATGNADGTRLPNLSDPGASQVFVPYGVDFSQRQDDRKRYGVYVAGEWRPFEGLTLGLTVFNSRYTLNSYQHLLMVDDSSDSVLAPGSTSTFNSAGLLTSTTGLAGYSYAQNGSATTSSGGGSAGNWGYVNNPYDFQSTVQNSTNATTDYSFTGAWTPNDRLDVHFAVQYVDSHAYEVDHYAYDYAFLPQVGLQLSGYGSDALPKLTIPSTIDLGNASNYGYLATMDHLTDNQGRETAAYVDAVYNLSDTALIRAIDFGAKISRRTEDDEQTPYNYQALSPYYDGGPYSMLAGSPNSNPAYNQLVNLSTWFNGQMGLPAAAYFPSLTELNTNFGTLHQQLGTGVNATQQAVQFQNGDQSSITDNTATIYAQAFFRNDSNPIAPFRGNFGLRIVDDKDYAAGNLLLPASLGTSYTPVTYPAPNYSASAISFTNPQTAFPNQGGHSEVDVLPSFNIQFLPTEQIHIRFAASEGVDRPSFQQLSPQGTLGGTYVGTYTQNFITSTLGNPDLRPETALQLDASFEYYFKSDGQAHIAFFYKKLHNYIGTESYEASYTLPTTVGSAGALPTTTAQETALDASLTPCPAPVTVGESCPQTVQATVQQYFNETAPATIQGMEVGLQKYASFLPAPWNGLGIDANYTYIDSHQPGAVAYDMLGNKINGLPVTGLSKDTVNFAVMYDSGPISMRLAYNWRDSFLVTTSAYQTSGTYDNLTNVADTTNAADVNTQGVSTYYALPVFQYPSGELDANFQWKLNKNITWVIQGSNLTDTVTRLYMGAGAERANRSWYTADRRYSTAIRWNF